jgi:hypothetical protein
VKDLRTFLADSFYDSLGRLTANEQARVTPLVKGIRNGSLANGSRKHPLDRIAGDFVSYSVNDDIRLIVHRSGSDQVICYVDHHDDAYRWAKRHRIEPHDATGAMQLVALEVVTRQIVQPVVTVEVPRTLANTPDRLLCACGVRKDCLDQVRLMTEDDLSGAMAEELLGSIVVERLIDLATGCTVKLPSKVRVGDDPYLHPDARQKFHLFTKDDELRGALTGGWEAWQTFLHPDQRVSVDRDHSGPARVTGGPGTGKTVVCVHRAVRLAKAGAGRVLLTTYTTTLADMLAKQVDQLLGATGQVRKRIEVVNLHDWAKQYLYRGRGEEPKFAGGNDVPNALEEAFVAHDPGFAKAFVQDEWQHVIEPLGITTLEAYLQVRREARGIPLNPGQRRRLWPTLAAIRDSLNRHTAGNWSDVARRAAEKIAASGTRPFAHVIVDEAQDLGPGELTLVRALVAAGPNDIFIASDPFQRIYRERATLARVGIDVRGRSNGLRVNYRMTEQIRRFADRLVTRPGNAGGAARSLMKGPLPRHRVFPSVEAERDGVVRYLRELVPNGFSPSDILVMARTANLLKDRAVPAIREAGFVAVDLRERNPDPPRGVRYCTMHRGKGLQYRAIILMGVDHDHLPLQSVMKRRPDETARRRMQELERNLLYVAMSRARERLFVTGAVKASPLIPGAPAVEDGADSAS